MKIITEYAPPPIPIRTLDWAAWYQDDEEGYIGYGATEAEAINDLKASTE